MSKTVAAGRALLLAIVAALGACAPAPGARAPSEAQVLPAKGPIAPATVKRLLLVDAVRAGERIVAVGDQGWILLSDDEGASWRRASAPDAPLLTAVCFVDAQHGWAVGHDETILATRDGGETWTKQFSRPSAGGPLLDVLFLDAQHGIAVGAYASYYATEDGGRTWTKRKIIPEDRHLNAIVRLSSSADARSAPGARLLIFGEEGTILASDDGGGHWAKDPSPYKGSLFGGLVADDGSVIAFGLRGKIFRTRDGGDTWTAVDNASQATLMGGTRLPDGELVLAGGAGTVLASRDQGRTFTPLANSESARLYSSAVAGRAGEVLVFGDAGARSFPLAPAQGAAAK
ncbi:MAG TPA: YCF48-related protein [Usitatibacter sp.]|nr:YCF48-related protein [Usitatibacter sp.]